MLPASGGSSWPSFSPCEPAVPGGRDRGPRGGRVSLPLGETVLAQLAAATANLLTPIGLGGSAVTARLLTRRGLRPSSAVGAVTALTVLGGVADFLVLASLVFFGRRLGLAGACHELGQLTSTLGHALTSPLSPWIEIELLLALGAPPSVRGSPGAAAALSGDQASSGSRSRGCCGDRWR
jgi:hypothetical protein